MQGIEEGNTMDRTPNPGNLGNPGPLDEVLGIMEDQDNEEEDRNILQNAYDVIAKYHDNNSEHSEQRLCQHSDELSYSISSNIANMNTPYLPPLSPDVTQGV